MEKTITMLRHTFLQALLLLLLATAGACRNDTEDADGDAARILHADARLCVCCGGWFVEVKNDTLRIVQMPDIFQKMLYEAKPSEFPCQ